MLMLHVDVEAGGYKQAWSDGAGATRMEAVQIHVHVIGH
jgi:hypothetical protein